MRDIAIDIRMAENTGIGRYVRGTLDALLKRPQNEFRYSFLSERAVPVYGLREQWAIPRLANRAECLHVPHYNAPLLWSKRLVVTIHDLIHLHFPEHLPSARAVWYARTLLPLVVEKADAIIAVSEYTKQDIMRHFGTSEKKITVIHHGVDERFKSPVPAPKIDAQKLPYFLYVGLLKAHKNIGTLLEAFKRFREDPRFKDWRLVLVGKADTKQAVVRSWLKQTESQKNVIRVCDIPDEQLSAWYQFAHALILPSYYEGFGFPLLEAMASGTPILTSRTSSLPEVAGEAALYFDPHSSQELLSCMQSLATDNRLRNDLIDKGRKRLSSFDWSNSAQKTERIYASVLR